MGFNNIDCQNLDLGLLNERSNDASIEPPRASISVPREMDRS